MDKNQGVPKGKKLPIIGDKNKAQSEEFVRQIMSYLDPILQQILTSIDTLERRVAVVEEVKQIFPAKVEVVVKHEHTIAEALQQESILKGCKEKK